MRDRINDRVRRGSQGEEGFTLIELLVVIIIIGILAAVVVFAVGGVGDKGKQAATDTDGDTVRTAQEAYCAQNGTFATEEQLVSGGFMSEQSKTWDIQLGPGGSCGVSTDATSGYGLVCALPEGCGTYGGTLIVAAGRGAAGTTTLTATLNPSTNSNGGEHSNSEAMYNGLLSWSSNNAAVPDLAEAYTISPDLKTAVFTLKPNMKWHNGMFIEATDVEFTFEQSLLRYHSRTAASMGPALLPDPGPVSYAPNATDPDLTVVPAGAITADNPTRKVTFNFGFGYAPLLRQMNVTEAPMIPMGVYKSCSALLVAQGGEGSGARLNQLTTTPFGAVPDDDAGLCPANQPLTGVANGLGYDTPVGSGPFKIDPANTSIASDGKITAVKNPLYGAIRPGLPYLDRLVIQEMATTAIPTNLNLPRSNSSAVDVGSPQPSDAPQFLTKDGYGFNFTSRGTGGGNCLMTMAFNLWKEGDTAGVISVSAAGAYTHPLFKNPAVRGAIYKALDRQTMFNNVEKKFGRPADSPYHSALVGAYTSTGVPGFDLNAAKAEMEAAGWKDFDSSDSTPRTAQGIPGIADGTAITPTDPAALSNNPAIVGTHLGDIKLIGFNSGTQGGSTQPNYTDHIISDLRRLGIHVTRWAQSPSSTRTTMAARNFDMSLISACHGDDPVIGVRRFYHSDQIQGNAFLNVAGYKETAMDGFWNTAISASGPAYGSAHGQIQAKARADLPYVWINETIGYRVFRSNCRGFNFANTGLYVETAYCT